MQGNLHFFTENYAKQRFLLRFFHSVSEINCALLSTNRTSTDGEVLGLTLLSTVRRPTLFSHRPFRRQTARFRACSMQKLLRRRVRRPSLPRLSKISPTDWWARGDTGACVLSHPLVQHAALLRKISSEAVKRWKITRAAVLWNNRRHNCPICVLALTRIHRIDLDAFKCGK